MCHTGYITGYIRIHVSWTLRHNTSRYIRIQSSKITIHVSWMRHDDTSGYIRDTSRYMYLRRFVRAALDTHKICSRCNADTFRIRILGSFYAAAAAGRASIRARLKGRLQAGSAPLGQRDNSASKGRDPPTHPCRTGLPIVVCGVLGRRCVGVTWGFLYVLV